MVWWFGITHYQTTLDAIREAGFRVSDVPAIWYKGKGGQTNHPDINLANSYETFFVACKGRGNILRPGRSNVFDFAPIPHQSKYHPTQKPVDLYMEILETFALPSALVCVPFLGSGAMLRAAYRYGTVGYGWDHSDEYKTGFLHAVQEDLQAGLIKETS